MYIKNFGNQHTSIKDTIRRQKIVEHLPWQECRKVSIIIMFAAKHGRYLGEQNGRQVVIQRGSRDKNYSLVLLGQCRPFSAPEAIASTAQVGWSFWCAEKTESWKKQQILFAPLITEVSWQAAYETPTGSLTRPRRIQKNRTESQVDISEVAQSRDQYSTTNKLCYQINDGFQVVQEAMCRSSFPTSLTALFWWKPLFCTLHVWFFRWDQPLIETCGTEPHPECRSNTHLFRIQPI